MGRNEKRLARICSKPKDYTYDELRQLLTCLQCVEDTGGRSSGSRMAFIHQPTKTILRLHQPHPGKELKAYQIKLVLGFLKLIGVIISEEHDGI